MLVLGGEKKKQSKSFHSSARVCLRGVEYARKKTTGKNPNRNSKDSALC